MARRRQNDGWWITPVAQLAGFMLLVALLIPGLRQALVSIGLLAVISCGMLVIASVGVCVFFWLIGKRRAEHTTENYALNQTLSTDQSWHAPESSQQSGRKSPLMAELVDQLRSMDWFQFEKLVAHVYEKRGYIVTRRGGANPDGGIDLVVEKDGQRAAIQCKQWKTWNVGVKAIREFLGALTDTGISKGIFVTLRGYTGEAKQIAEKHGIEILNEAGLAEMLEGTDARYDPQVLELLHDTRKFCPKCERELVIRIAKSGPNRGSKFWGCSGFPQGCRFTMPISGVNDRGITPVISNSDRIPRTPQNLRSGAL